MKNVFSSEPIKRRHLIARGYTLGATLCFGCAHLFTSANAQEDKTVKTLPDRFSQDTGMTYEQVFNFAFRESTLMQGHEYCLLKWTMID